MAKRSYYRRRRYPARRRAIRKNKKPNIMTVKRPWLGGMSLGQMARYAATGVNLMKGIINSELKRYTSQLSGLQGFTPAVTQMSFIDQGNDVENRAGNSILGKYLSYSTRSTINPTSTVPVVCRFIIFVDTEPRTGTVPSAADLLDDPTSIISPLNVDHTARFTVLEDIHVDLSPSGNQVVTTKSYKKLDFHIKYTGPEADLVEKNNIYCLLQSESSDTTNFPQMSIYWRIAYYDN